MRKILLLIVVFAMSLASASAQTFVNKDDVLSFGVGISNKYNFPVYLSYERCILELNATSSLGVGLTSAIGGRSNVSVSDLDDGISAKNKYFLLGANTAYHYTGFERLDLSVGLLLGFANSAVKWTSSEGVKSKYSNGSFLWGLDLSAIYYLTEQFGVEASLGHGVATFALGIAYKF